MADEMTNQDLLDLGYTFRPVPEYKEGSPQAVCIRYQLYDPEGKPVMVTNNRACIQGVLKDLPKSDESVGL